MAKITPRKAEGTTVVVKTMPDKKLDRIGAWWKASTKDELAQKVMGTAAYIKENSQFRYRQAAIYARLYGNMPLFGWAGSNLSKIAESKQLPLDRPTMSVITSCVDTLVSRLTQSRPRPLFLTDNGDYKQRHLAEEMNSFVAGEFYQTKAYELGPLALRDGCVLGSGLLKVCRDQENKVSLERRLCTELLVDPNDALYGFPRSLYELKLMDRDVLADMFPKYRSMIQNAEQAFPDSGDSSKTTSDQVMVVEAWHLPSGPTSKDGRHSIVCSEGTISDEEYTKKRFPFPKIDYSPRMLGHWAQGLPEQLMGTQVEINKILMTITNSINLVGVPRVFVEDGSKVVSSHLNNMIGAIIKYRGTKPVYEVAPCVPVEMYTQLERLVQYAFQQSGISSLSASSQKPAGLNSGAALREYDDLQTDRFASLSKRYEDFYVDLAYLMIDEAKDIAKETGKYQTVYPNKDGVKQINLPMAKLLEDPFVIQCFDVSSLPKDPAGRLQQITEMMQAGIVDPKEGRRLLGYPDIEQVDKLENAAEERILKILDGIVEDGEYTPPDPFMDLQLAEKLCTQYYNLYTAAKLEENRAQLLRNFASQIQTLKQAAMSAMAPPPGAMQPQATPMAKPQSDLMPQVAPQGPQ